jgi:hypothetical protein
MMTYYNIFGRSTSQSPFDLKVVPAVLIHLMLNVVPAVFESTLLTNWKGFELFVVFIFFNYFFDDVAVKEVDSIPKSQLSLIGTNGCVLQSVDPAAGTEGLIFLNVPVWWFFLAFSSSFFFFVGGFGCFFRIGRSLRWRFQ